MSTYEYLCNLRDTGHKTNPERIVCAANVFKDGTIVLGEKLWWLPENRINCFVQKERTIQMFCIVSVCIENTLSQR